ncbi:MAG: hypothetical protein JXN59_09800 [Anaerolineae bacterium]|nr:hypothetical protein [Anaerolineae bacterium]
MKRQSQADLLQKLKSTIEPAARCSRGDVRRYIEAVELTAHRDREAVLAALEKRL